MRVEFVKDWQRFRVGQTVEHLSGGVVDALLRTKIVRPAPVADAAPDDNDDADGEHDATDLAPKRRRKGK